MAKKIRKHRRRTTLGSIFILLALPWIVLGAIAVGLYKAGASDTVAILVALAGSLAATYLIRMYQSRKGKPL